MARHIAFVGQGPFYLPAAQRATAIGGSNGVEMSLYVLVSEEDATLRPVHVQMAGKVARELGVELLRAVDDAELELEATKIDRTGAADRCPQVARAAQDKAAPAAVAQGNGPNRRSHRGTRVTQASPSLRQPARH